MSSRALIPPGVWGLNDRADLALPAPATSRVSIPGIAAQGKGNDGVESRAPRGLSFRLPSSTMASSHLRHKRHHSFTVRHDRNRNTRVGHPTSNSSASPWTPLRSWARPAQRDIAANGTCLVQRPPTRAVGDCVDRAGLHGRADDSNRPCPVARRSTDPGRDCPSGGSPSTTEHPETLPCDQRGVVTPG
jgi:hypothetical protein